MQRFNLLWKSNVHSPAKLDDHEAETKWSGHVSTSAFFWLMIKLTRHIIHRTEYRQSDKNASRSRNGAMQVLKHGHNIYPTWQLQFSTMEKCLLVHILSYSHVLTSKKPWTTKRFFFSSVRYSDRGWGVFPFKVMHLSMLSPRGGTPGICGAFDLFCLPHPREFDLESGPQGGDVCFFFARRTGS